MLKPRGTFKPEVYVVQPCPKNFPHPSRRLHTGSYGHALRCGFSGLSKGGVSQPLRPCTARVQTGLRRENEKIPKKCPHTTDTFFPEASQNLKGLFWQVSSVCFILYNAVELQCYTKDNDQEFEEIYNLAMSLTVENDHATVVRATSSKF